MWDSFVVTFFQLNHHLISIKGKFLKQKSRFSEVGKITFEALYLKEVTCKILCIQKVELF